MTTFDRATAAHLFRRAGFGAGPARIDRALEAGLDRTIDELFAQRDGDELLSAGAEAVVATGRIEALASWWMARILRDGAPLVERVALLWHGHFATSWDKVRDTRLMHEQIQLFRRLGLGSFRELLHAVATDPAMLVWLDGNENKKGHPNENFARELLELFGLGIGSYDETDVREAARAFSGWGVDGRRFVFRPQHHDEGEKSFLGARGRLDGRGAVDAVLEHPSCARHVARRLVSELVRPRPAAGEVERWARVLVEEDWHVGRTVARLLRSPEFLAPGARRSRIAGPVELVAITAHALELELVPAAAARAAAEMGQSLLRPPSVKGWDGGRAWIHAGSWLARHNHLIRFVDRGLEPQRRPRGLAADGPDAIVRSVTERLFPEGIDERLRGALARAAGGPPNDALRRTLVLALTSPEYHLV